MRLYCHNCYNSAINTLAWHSAPALKCNGYGLESWLAGHLEKGSGGGGPVCGCMG